MRGQESPLQEGDRVDPHPSPLPSRALPLSKTRPNTCAFVSLSPAPTVPFSPTKPSRRRTPSEMAALIVARPASGSASHATERRECAAARPRSSPASAPATPSEPQKASPSAAPISHAPAPTRRSSARVWARFGGVGSSGLHSTAHHRARASARGAVAYGRPPDEDCVGASCQAGFCLRSTAGWTSP